jgi:L-fucose isomerase-like protein
MWVWSYLDVYPGRIEVDCKDLTPNLSIKIGDVEKMLPHGMYLHKKYDTMKFHSVVRLQETNSYVGRRNMVIEQAEKIKEQRREMQSSLLEKKSEANKKSKREKVVPKHAISAKVLKKEIAAQKKDAGL